MLLTDPPPQDIIIRKTFPLLVDLGSPAERGGVEVGEDPERHFVREDGEGVDADDVGELVNEERELREAAHCQQSLENQGTPGVG